MVQVILSKTAEKSFLKLPTDAKKKISKGVEKLIEDPLAGEKLRGEYEGRYKLYAWPYRIIYMFNPVKKIVTIVEIEHRQGAYK